MLNRYYRGIDIYHTPHMTNNFRFKIPENITISTFFHTFLALSPGEVWTLDRGVFQQIMMQTGMKKIEEKLNFLKSVPIFSKMSNDILLRLSDALEVVSNNS